MPLNWDDDDDEDLTEADYKRRSSRVLVHEEVTTSTGSPQDYVRPKETKAPSAKPLESWPAPRPSPEPILAAPPRPRTSNFVAASMRDRFAAFFIDTLLGFYLYLLVGFFLNKFFNTPNFSVLHQSTGRLLIHAGLTVGIVFFYYVLMESVLGATLGKLFCRLRVLEENGDSASLGNVFIRNFLRIVDYPLGFLVAVITMESSPLHQRLGDRAAKTIVIKKTRRYLPAVDLTQTPLASTLSRLFAEAIDLLLALSFLYGLLLLMRPNRPFLSYVIYISAPWIFIAYYTLLEFLTGTTPGKSLFKRQVVLDNGEPPDGTSSLLRNLFRPLDYLLGYPLMILSKKKQRLGDMAADTLVVAKPSGPKGLWGSLLAVALTLLFVYLGFTNPHSIVREKFGLTPLQGFKVFLPGSRLKPPTSGTPQKSPGPSVPAKSEGKPTADDQLPASTSETLKLEEFYFATGPAPGQIRHDKTFRPGDLIFAFFKIQGFQVKEGQEVELSEDLVVEDPEGKAILSELGIVHFTKSVNPATPSVLFANNIKLPKESPQGKYRAIFTLYDKIAGTQFSFKQDFEIK